MLYYFYAILFKANKKFYSKPTSDPSSQQCFKVHLTFVLVSEAGVGGYGGANQVSVSSDTTLDTSPMGVVGDNV